MVKVYPRHEVEATSRRILALDDTRDMSHICPTYGTINGTTNIHKCELYDFHMRAVSASIIVSFMIVHFVTKIRADQISVVCNTVSLTW